MEEKERYELFGEHCIKDNSPDARPQLLDTYKACVILNQQHKRIKELEDMVVDKQNKLYSRLDEIKKLQEENKELNDYLETDEVTKREYYQKVDEIDKAKDREIKKLKDKIKELEDYTENTANLIDKLTEDSVFASTQLAIEKLKKIKEEFTSEKWDLYDTPDLLEQVCELRNNQIKYIDKQIKELGGEKNE